jgi:acetate kinase
MHILVLNSGSSSIKFSFFDAEEGAPASLFEGEVSGIGGSEAKVTFRDADGHDLAPAASGGRAKIASIDQAVEFVARAVSNPEVPPIDAIGYRVVHPGALLHGHQRITDEVLKDLREAAAFAPLHDPAVVKLIEAMRKRFPDAEHFACFDTVFHETMPPEATTYPIAQEFAAKGVRRYGFHGLSCESIVVQLREAGGEFPRRMAIAHLGGGCSVTALVDGLSVDTSMGLTPTGGIVMATRPGDLDPGLVLYLLRQDGATLDSVEAMLNHKAGLAGLSGISGDMREVRTAAEKGDERAALALKVFTRSVRKMLGSYLALLGGLDAIVFSGGIGEHDVASRAEVLAGLEALGVILDPDANAEKKDGLRTISAAHSAIPVYIVPAEEDLMIARHVARLS